MSELERLLALARDAEPEALDAAATDALVRGAMRTAAPQQPEAPSLEQLLAAARDAEPEPLDDLAVRRMAQRAAMTGGARHNTWTRRRLMVAAGVAAAAAAAAVTLWWLPTAAPPDPVAEAPRAVERERPTRPDEANEPTDLELPTGDRIVAASGARFSVEMARPEERRVRLGGGTMLFDVRPIDGGRFSVSTPNAEVLVLGTVFTVHATDEGTTVHVYEGRVQVRGYGSAGGHDAVRVVTAGGMVHLGGGDPASDTLAREGRAAARERDAVASSEEAPSQVSPGLPARRRVASERGPAVEPEPSVEAHDVRLWIARGDAARALDQARRHTEGGRVDPWRMLEGDALRALGQHADAADIYRRATVELPPPRRQQAGFLEARLRAAELGDPAGALRALRDAEVTAPSSPLRERGLALEVQLLTRLGRHGEVREIAQEYLEDYPEGSQSEAMRRHMAEP